MSLNYEPGQGRSASMIAVDQAMTRVQNLGMTERQRRLNFFYTWYSGVQYDARTMDFDGRERLDPLEKEALIRGSFVPPGYYAANADYPVELRRPSVPGGLCRVIVHRYTELLFAEHRIPRVKVDGDLQTEDYTHALIDACDLWGRFMYARNLGGAQGSVAVGFQLVRGEPLVEVHDARWCFPTFRDLLSRTLSRLEVRWIYHQDERRATPRGTGWVSVPYWYRRVIDETTDTTFLPVEVEEGDDPAWEPDPEKTVDHKLGFVPVVWIQNHEVGDDIDGEPDCAVTYDMMEQRDILRSMAVRGTKHNCDPTVFLATEAKLDEVKKGSDNTVKLFPGDTFEYKEIAGSGPQTAMTIAKDLKDEILETAQVVLPPVDGGAVPQTLGQVTLLFSSMLARAAQLRRQYGKAALTLLGLMLKAIRKLNAGVRLENNQVQKQVVRLPPKVIASPDGSVNTEARRLGNGTLLRLVWPPFFSPSPDDIQKITTATGEAKEKGLIDQQHASEAVAPYYGVHDTRKMIEQLKKEQKEAADQQAQQAAGPGADPNPFGG